MTCQSINLHFVAIKEHLHTIDLIQLQDNDSGVVVNMTDGELKSLLKLFLATCLI